MKKTFSFFIALILIISMAVPAFTVTADIDEQLGNTLAVLLSKIPSPAFGDEWTVLAMARSGYSSIPKGYFEDYYDKVEAVLKDNNGILPDSATKKSEYSRLIITLNAIGKDPANVGGYDLTAWLSSMSKAGRQGINGAVYALIALDSGHYVIPDIVETADITGYNPDTDDQTTRQKIIDFILAREVKKGSADAGGFSLTGHAPDIDMTAMALQALAPYRSDSAVAGAIERALTVLSKLQNPDGTYSSWGKSNSESVSQMLIALSILGINPAADTRFSKGENNLLSALLQFRVDGGGFRHTAESGFNGIATEQAACALTAYARFMDEAKALYDMSDAPNGWRYDFPDNNDSTTDDGNQTETTNTDITTTDNNETTTKTEPQNSTEISSKLYKIESGFIKNISEGTTAEAFLSHINENNIKLFLADGNTEVAVGTTIATGMLVRLMDDDGGVIRELTIVLKGDVDGNGKISVTDARHALRCCVKIAPLEGAFFAAADLNEDGVVSTSHARMILRYAVKVEISL